MSAQRAAASEITCGGEDPALASLGGQKQAESSVSGVHRSVHKATSPTLLNVFVLLFTLLCQTNKNNGFVMETSTAVATVHAKVA